MAELLSVQEAHQRILAKFNPVETVDISFDHAIDRILASDIPADIAWPPFDNSSMDGFAVCAVDTTGAKPDHPIQINVVADIPAGTEMHVQIKPGEAARIMTGAPVPDGADAVIPIEDTHQNREAVESSILPEFISVFSPARSGQFIRPAGQDIHKGQIVLQAGRKLKPADIGLLAMLGEVNLKVYRKPRVALISTGDELVPPGHPLKPGKIRDSNTYMLAGLVESAGGEILQLGFTADRFEDVQARLDQAAESNIDLILTSAGVSVGAFDFIRAVVESHGNLDFWRVNMRPGKPLTVGDYRGKNFIGLPGNPVSAYVGFEVFVRPAINRLAGMAETERLTYRARTAHNIESDGRESYLRARIYKNGEDWEAALTGHQGSGNLFSIVDANSLLVVPAGVKSLPAGSEVVVWLLNQN